jgi:carboxymethylenebutenolidase
MGAVLELGESMRPIPSSLEPKQLSDPDVSPGVWGVLEIPPAAGPRPGVILLVGSSGWHAAFAEIAKSLADLGFVALALDYLAETGREPSAEEQLRHWPIWEATVRNAVAYLQGSQYASSEHIGLVGYSLGAFLAVSVASKLPGVRAVVDFFGGGAGGTQSLDDEVRNMPPLLILHGEADSIVPVSSAYRLRDAVITQGGQVEMHIYPGAEHAFNAPWSPMYSEAESSDSLKRTVDFLARWLGK